MIDREELERLSERLLSQAFDRYAPTELLKEAARTINALAAENARIEDANRIITTECTKWAREAGLAKGRLEGSELPGIVDQWREKCERIEAENASLREERGQTYDTCLELATKIDLWSGSLFMSFPI